jgi:hypothetical protein
MPHAIPGEPASDGNHNVPAEIDFKENIDRLNDLMQPFAGAPRLIRRG